MKPLAFISHSESGGAETSVAVRGRLRHEHLDLDSFYSQINMVPGDDLHEEIIRNIVNTDILIGIIDPDASVSKWVEWEHNFCKKRNLIRIPIIFPSIWENFKQNQISFLDNGELVIHYNSGKDIMLDSFFSGIKNHKDQLIKRVEEKEKIKITLNPINSTYQNKDIITISGQVESTGLAFLEFNLSKIYLYRRNFELGSIPIKEDELIESIDLDDHGRFSYDFELSKIDIVDKTQKWFFEIRFDNKSEIAVASICPPDTSVSGIVPPEIPPSGTTPTETPTDTVRSDSFNQIREKIKSFSSGTFSSISKKIKDYTIDRNLELSQLIGEIRKHEKIVLTGNKGSGKSVILCELYDQLKESDDILFVRCDDYLHIQNISELETILFGTKPLYEIVQEYYDDNNKLLIFFDSLDAISRNSRVFEIFKQFLKQLWGTNKIKTICSVRSYDYEYSHSISSTDWGEKFNLTELSNEQLNKTLDYLDNPQVSEELRPILKNPLNLKILSLILEKSNTQDLHSITSEIDLYNEHWKEYVEKSENPSVLKDILFLISKEMIEKQRISIVVPINYSETALTLALSTNLLEKDSDTNIIQFFHHAYLDYVVSRYLLESFENLDEFIIQQKYNIFLRPTIIFTLSILQMKNQELFLNNVKRLLSNEQIKYYWKFSVLHVFSSITIDDTNKVDVFGELFTEKPLLRQHFLRESTKGKNSFWFYIWQDSFIKTWAEEPNTNNRFLLNYLQSILSEVDHSNLFETLQIIVEKNYDEWTQKTAVEVASILNVEKGDWYVTLSNHSSSYVRWGVIESLENLIEGGTKNISKIFSNVFLYKEESDDKTVLPSGNSLVLQSNKKQDNSQVIWIAGEIFHKLLEKKPTEFIHSVAIIIEEKQKEYLKQKGTVIEDGGLIWYESGLDRLHGENKLLAEIENFLANCDEPKLKEFIPILTQTRLATLHRIALTAMFSNINFFKEEIISELLIPEIYKIETLENTVRHTIKKISPLLTDQQLQSIMKPVIEISFPESRLDEEKTKEYVQLYQAKFWSSFPVEKLSSEQKQLLEHHSQEELKERPKRNFDVKFEPVEESPIEEKKSPIEIIDSNLGENLEHRPKIELLKTIIEYLGSKTEELDSSKLSGLRDFILSNVTNEDPKENSDDKDTSTMWGYDTIRGLTSKCLIRMYYHTKNKELIEPIEQLSNDPINIVRADVAHDLRYLYAANPTLTLQIVTKYSKESDHRVQFYLSDIVSVLAHKHPQETIDIIKNIVLVNYSKNGKFIQYHEGIITYLALIKQNETAKSLLKDLVTNPDFPDEYRENLPFILKESYLHNESTQDEALEIFSMLLDSENHITREKATFFLLATLKDEPTSDVKKIIDKIQPHLDKISKEIEREKWDLRIIEELIKFLEKNWKYIPQKSIEYLEKIAKDNKKYLEFHSWIADGAILILNGLFREGDLSIENKQVCLDILDKFAMVGWPRALDLLSSMERPD